MPEEEESTGSLVWRMLRVNFFVTRAGVSISYVSTGPLCNSQQYGRACVLRVTAAWCTGDSLVVIMQHQTTQKFAVRIGAAGGLTAQ